MVDEHMSQTWQAHRQWNPLPWLRKESGLGDRTEADWVEALNTVIAELEQMNRSTERDFLAITEKLAGFSSSAREISSGTRDLLDSIGGEKGKSACQALLAVLEIARDMLRQANAAAGLAESRQSVARIRRSLAGFERVGPSFQVMATLAQIETAHLGSAGLEVDHLADDFRSAGRDIRSHVDCILDGAAGLERRIEAALGETSAFDAQGLQALPHLIETTQRGLGEFAARREQSAAGAKRVAAQSDSCGRAIADIVAAIQVHDITRQQVEHVVDSLRQLARDASGNGSSSRPPAGSAAAIELQLAQLANAETVFVDGMRQMDRRLATVADQISAMAAETGTLLGAGDSGDESTFFSRMESSFRAIADTAAGCHQIEERTRGALAGLQHTLEALRKSIREIHTVENRLRWLAINAAISAAHIGIAGEPLEAVAGAMRELLAECEKSSVTTEDTIHSMIDVVRSAAGSSVHLETAAGEAAFDQLQIEIRDLRSLSRKAAQRTADIAQIASRLSSEVAALRGSVSAEGLFTSAIENCSRVLRRVRTQMAADDGPVDRSALTRFEQQYTMHAEREIHVAVLHASQPPATPARAAPPAAGAEFGDNVELF